MMTGLLLLIAGLILCRATRPLKLPPRRPTILEIEVRVSRS
jgi:hypothetical protein